MTQRFAISSAPARDSLLWERATAWLGQPALQALTASARRYGFHATLKAPMRLREGTDRAMLEAWLGAFARHHAPVPLANLAPRLLGGFVALTSEPQAGAVTDLAATVTASFERFRAPLSADERSRRLAAPLTPRQAELVDLYGYPYVLEKFVFHMTLTDRLAAPVQDEMVATAAAWFANALAAPVVLDRLVLFREPAPGAVFERLEDYRLTGTAP
jgi:hypothetical protein